MQTISWIDTTQRNWSLMQQVKNLDRKELLKPKTAAEAQKPKNEKSVIATKYNPGCDINREITTKNWPLLGRNKTTYHI